MNIHTRTHRSILMTLCAIAILTGLVATLKSFSFIEGFWEDEFYPIAFINESYSSFVFSVARLDIHPPLHYFQLKLWAELFPGDKGLLFNSVFWHLVSGLVIFQVGRAWKGLLAGLLAVSIYALVPQMVWASVTLRQYAFIPALAVGAWWLNMRVLTRATSTRADGFMLAAIELALAFSHAIAFYFVPWIALAAAALAYQEKGKNAPWKRWIVVQVIVAALLIPLALMALMRTGIPGNDAPTGNLLLFVGALVAGWGMKSELGRWLGLALYGLFVLAGLRHRDTRPVTLFILVAPLVVAILVTAFIAPMLKAPVYASMLIPFAALATGAALSTLSEKLACWLSAVIVVSLMAAVFPAMDRLLVNRNTNPWKEVANEVKQRATAGDLVVIPKPFSFWAVMRYAVAEDWGAPIEILPPLNERWSSLTQKLGPDLSRFLHLIPRTDHVTSDGITYVVNNDVAHLRHTAKHIWVIHSLPYAVPVQGADRYVDQGPVWRGEQQTEMRRLGLQPELQGVVIQRD